MQGKMARGCLTLGEVALCTVSWVPWRRKDINVTNKISDKQILWSTTVSSLALLFCFCLVLGRSLGRRQ